MSPAFFALALSLASALAQVPPQYTYNGIPYCPHGYHLEGGKCWPIRSRYVPQQQPRWPESGRDRGGYEPQSIVSPTPADCPQGYKKARGQCSKMTERELELDRLPKEPCPPGQRRARLVCTDYDN